MKSFESFHHKRKEFFENLDLNPEKATPFKVHNEIQALLMLDGAPFEDEEQSGEEAIEINLNENNVYEENNTELTPFQKHQIKWITENRDVYNQAFDELIKERPTLIVEWYDDPEKIADMVKNRMIYIRNSDSQQAA